MPQLTFRNVRTLVVVSLALVGCRLDDNPITISPSTGTTLTNAQTMTLLAVIDAAALRARLGDEAASASHVEFRHRAEAQSGTDFAVICVDDKPPYACDWSVTAADNGTHQWVAALFTAQGKILGMAGTELHVEIPAPRGLPRPLADCSDGVDCFCDRVQDRDDPTYDPGVFFCEDFENPDLPNRGAKGEWGDLYGPGGASCNVDPPGPDNSYCSFGREEDDAVDIVDEGSYGCEVPGEDDCVLDGSHALGHRLRVSDGSFEDTTGGIMGEINFTPVRTFGYTMALRYSHNYRAPGEGNTGPAHKMNEFGDGKHCLIGCSTNHGVGRNHPYRGGVFAVGQQPITILRGDAAFADSGSLGYVPERSVYEWGRTHGTAQWMCLQIHWRGWGTSNAEFRGWMNDELVMHFQDIDMSNLGYDQDGIGSFYFNHYYNGPGEWEGYPGPTLAYRYEDNVVMTASDEPVSCAAIGFVQ